ncbi:MAG TPA: diguanylate cyclase, partial [Actinomycetales bacterium]
RSSALCSLEPSAGWQADVAVAVLAALTHGYVYTVDGVVHEVSDAFCAMTGFTREQLVGTAAPFPFWPEDGIGAEAEQEVVFGLEQGRQVEMSWRRSDGTRFDVEVILRPVPSVDGTLRGHVTVARDLSELRAREATLRSQAAHLRAMAAASHAILTDADPRKAICEAAHDVADASGVTLLEVVGSHLVATATTGPAARVPVQRDLGHTSSLLVQVHRSGQPVMVDDTQRHSVTDLPGAHSALCLPVFGARQAQVDGAAHGEPETERRVIGVLAVALPSSPSTGVLELLAVLQVLAGEASVAIERADLHRRLAEQARTDGLTGLANRRTWEEELPLILARASRSGEPVSIAMIDLDHFKAYNDAHGHPAGDTLLREAAAAWTAALRSTDLLARYGGEEFVVALPGCPAMNAVEMLQRLSSALPAGTTASIGLTQWDRSESASMVAARADSALYEAKRRGRDQIRIVSPPTGGRAAS